MKETAAVPQGRQQATSKKYGYIMPNLAEMVLKVDRQVSARPSILEMPVDPVDKGG